MKLIHVSLKLQCAGISLMASTETTIIMYIDVYVFSCYYYSLLVQSCHWTLSLLISLLLSDTNRADNEAVAFSNAGLEKALPSQTDQLGSSPRGHLHVPELYSGVGLCSACSGSSPGSSPHVLHSSWMMSARRVPTRKLVSPWSVTLVITPFARPFVHWFPPLLCLHAP